LKKKEIFYYTKKYPEFLSIQIIADLIQQFAFYCASLRTKVMYDFDKDEENNHRCKVEEIPS
jgi:hypothetical protein